MSSKRHRKKLRRAHRAREARIRLGRRGGLPLYVAIFELIDEAARIDARRTFVEKLLAWGIHDSVLLQPEPK